MTTNRSSAILAGTLIATALAVLAVLGPPRELATARPALQVRPSPTVPNQPTPTATPWSMPGIGLGSLPGCASTGSTQAPKEAAEDGEAITWTISIRITCPTELTQRTVVVFVGTRTALQLPALRATLVNTIDQLAQAGVGRVAVVRAEDAGTAVLFHSGDAALNALRAELAALPAAGPVPADRWVARIEAVNEVLTTDPAQRPMLILFDGTDGDAAADALWPIPNRTLLDLNDGVAGPGIVLDLSGSVGLRGNVRAAAGLGSNVFAAHARSGHASDLPVFVWRALTGLGGPITGWQVQAGLSDDLRLRNADDPFVWRGRALSTTVDIRLQFPVVAHFETGRASVNTNVLFSRLGPLGEAGYGGGPSGICVYPTGRPEACAPPTEFVPPTRTATATPNGTPTGSPTPRPTRPPVPTSFPDWVYVEPVPCAVTGAHALTGPDVPLGSVVTDTLTVRLTCPQLLRDRRASIVVGALDARLMPNLRTALRQLGLALAGAGETDIALHIAGDPARATFTVPRDAAAYEAAVNDLAGRPAGDAATWRMALAGAVDDALAASPDRRPIVALLDGGAPAGDPAAAVAPLDDSIARVRAADGIVLLFDVTPDAWLRAPAAAAGIDSASVVYFRPFGALAEQLSSNIYLWAASANEPIDRWEAETHFPTLLDVDDRLVDPPALGSNALGATWNGTAEGHDVTLRLSTGGRTTAPLVDTSFLTTLRIQRGPAMSYQERFWSVPMCIHPATDPLWCAQAQGTLRRVFLPWALRMP